MQTIQLRVTPVEASSEENITKVTSRKLSLTSSDIDRVIVRKRSVDARQRQIYVNLTVDVYLKGEQYTEDTFDDIIYQDVSGAKSIIIVGAGPAGLFAALRALELGVKPIVVERGKDVISRRRDVADIAKTGIVLPESNYGYGEGGAGAFSDGKLYTRSKKRGSVDKVLRTFCKHGAQTSILIDAHPHIGTDRLPMVIKKMRETILSHGGEVYFNTRMDSLILEKQEVRGIRTSDGLELIGPVILATGHSARDVYRYLHVAGILLESKSIAVGVRLEHPQQIIDAIRYHNPKGRGEYLPAAEYVYKTQVMDRGVYSFCMCPGGFVVPASTAPNETVVNGMSPANRGSKWANSGMVVEIRPEDIKALGFKVEDPRSPMNLLYWCEDFERKSYHAANCSLHAPAQRMTDFVNRKQSANLPSSSYPLDLTSSNLYDWMPALITESLAQGFKAFDKVTKGFLTNEAQLIGVESRTSSPVRIPREPMLYNHITIKGLYPAGEGAGYAGGIVSAAIDGQNCMEAAAAWVSAS
ncbi:NAD(P)/FAD-dependent oxidoreductase [Porphyromonas pogonae]|uniref:NAD(P)/FAD-dependent oxidoreductase n=1 Tax=Porphyromonas pogonae TaxID=867595 RepID=UPI002E780009|nr:FAD-binding protein [Porphyromonas pogonae]